MSGLGMRGICPNASKRTTVPDSEAPERPDLIRRDFSCPVPTTRLVGDITYLRTTGGFIYLAVAMDLCTRMVVGWSIRDSMRAELAAWAAAHGVRLSVGRTGSCHDNAVAEGLCA